MQANRYFENALLNLGYPSKFVKTTVLSTLKEHIQNLKHQGKLNEKIEADYLNFDFSLPEDFHSLLITACPLNNSSFDVETSFGIKQMVIPTVYYESESTLAFNQNITDFLDRKAITWRKVHLPLKLLASLAGLSTYGRNTISYIESLGSYYKLSAFFTTVPIETNWLQEPKQNILCHHCTICSTLCPSQIINSNSPFIDGGHCISFPNEIPGDFPDWLNPAWHNALMGCIKCQSNCPINKPFQQMNHLLHLSIRHIKDIHKHDLFEDLESDTQHQIKALSFHEDYNVFRRNFIALYKNINQP